MRGLTRAERHIVEALGAVAAWQGGWPVRLPASTGQEDTDRLCALAGLPKRTGPAAVLSLVDDGVVRVRDEGEARCYWLDAEALRAREAREHTDAEAPPAGQVAVLAGRTPTACAEGLGVRNLDCTAYDACLDAVGAAGHRGWTCASCAWVGADPWSVEDGVDWHEVESAVARDRRTRDAAPRRLKGWQIADREAIAGLEDARKARIARGWKPTRLPDLRPPKATGVGRLVAALGMSPTGGDGDEAPGSAPDVEGEAEGRGKGRPRTGALPGHASRGGRTDFGRGLDGTAHALVSQLDDRAPDLAAVAAMGVDDARRLLGLLLRGLRLRRGLTQDDARATLGIGSSTMGHVENGRTHMALEWVEPLLLLYAAGPAQAAMVRDLAGRLDRVRRGGRSWYTDRPSRPGVTLPTRDSWVGWGREERVLCIGRIMRGIREWARMTQKQAADRLGSHQTWVSDIETGDVLAAERVFRGLLMVYQAPEDVSAAVLRLVEECRAGETRTPPKSGAV